MHLYYVNHAKNVLKVNVIISPFPSAVVTVDEEPCLLLPLHTREKVEKLLFRGNEGDNCDHMDDSDWCNLAGLLGSTVHRPVCMKLYEYDQSPALKPFIC